MNETLGCGECSKCGRRTYVERTPNSDQRFECPYCDAVGEWLELGDLLGPLVFHRFQEFIVPQYEKDQNFSEAFRDAFRAFMKPNHRYECHLSDGSGTYTFHSRNDSWDFDGIHDNGGLVRGNDPEGGRTTFSIMHLDKIVRYPKTNLTPEVADTVKTKPTCGDCEYLVHVGGNEELESGCYITDHLQRHSKDEPACVNFDLKENDEENAASLPDNHPEVCSDCIRKDTEHCGYEHTFWPKDCHKYQRKEPILPLGLYSPKEKLMFVPHYSPVFEGDIVKCRGTGWEYKLGAGAEGVPNRCGHKAFTVVACVGKDIPTHVANRFGISRMNSEGFSNCEGPSGDLIDKVSNCSSVMEAFKVFCEQPSLVEAFNYSEDNPDYPRWTDRAREMMLIAKRSAREHRSIMLNIYHVLFGILGVPECIAHTVLKNKGNIHKTNERVKFGLLNTITSILPAASLPAHKLSSDLDEAIKFGMEAAEEMKCHYFGTEHMLLGLLKQARDFSTQHMHALYGMDYDTAYKEVQKILGMKPEGCSLSEIVSQVKGKSLARRPCWAENIRLKVYEDGGLYVFNRDIDPENVDIQILLTMKDIEAKDWVEDVGKKPFQGSPHEKEAFAHGERAAKIVAEKTKQKLWDMKSAEQTYTLDEIILKIDGQYLARRLVWPDSIRMKVLDLNTPFIFDSDPENKTYHSVRLVDIQATDWVIIAEKG